MNEKIEVPTMQVPPLKKICMTIGQLPTSYLETMSYYEMLVWFVNYLRDDIIPVVNANGAATEELQELFVALQKYVNDYFDDLNIQTEVNNKLDDMLENGELEQIIEQFLQSTSIWCFDTIADLKQATNLIAGSYAKTLGYYAKDDGGESLYYITAKGEDETTDDIFKVLINTNYVGNLITLDKMNSMQFGIDNTGTNNIKTTLNKVLSYFNGKPIEIVFANGTYLLNDEVYLYSNQTLDFNHQEVLINDTTKIINHNDENNHVEAIENITIKNGLFNGYSLSTYSTIFKIAIIHGNNINILNNTFYCCTNAGSHIIEIGGCENVNIKENYFHNGTNSIDNSSGEIINLDQANYESIPYWNSTSSLYDNKSNKNVYIIKNEFKQENPDEHGFFNAIGTHAFYTTDPHFNINIENNTFGVPSLNMIKFINWENVNIENNIFIVEGNQTTGTVKYCVKGNRGGYVDGNTTIYASSKNVKIHNNVMKSINSTYNDDVSFCEYTGNANTIAKTLVFTNNIVYSGRIDSTHRGTNGLRTSYVENAVVSNNILYNCKNALGGANCKNVTLSNNVGISCEKFDNFTSETGNSHIVWTNNINNDGTKYEVKTTTNNVYLEQSTAFNLSGSDTYQKIIFDPTNSKLENPAFTFDTTTGLLTYTGFQKTFKVSYSLEFVARATGGKYASMTRNTSDLAILKRSITAPTGTNRLAMAAFGYVTLNTGDTMYISVFGTQGDTIDKADLLIEEA